MGDTATIGLQIELWINLIFAVVMTGYLVYIVINSKRTSLLYNYCLVHALTMLIVVNNFISSIAPNKGLRWNFIMVTYILKLMFDVRFILYVRPFFKSFGKVLMSILVTVYIVIGSGIILTNPLHHLFVSKISAYEYNFGICYYIIMGAGFVLEVTGLLLIMKYWVKKLDNQSYRIMASFVTIICMLFLHLFLMKAFDMAIDFMPIILLTGFTFFFFGANKYGMFGAISFQSTYGLEMFTDALLITGKHGKVIYKNQACEALGEETLQEILSKASVNVVEDENKRHAIVTEIELVSEDDSRNYTLIEKPVRRRIFSSQKQLHIIHDNTKSVAAINLLTEKNQYLQETNDSVKTLAEDSKKLAVLTERNFLAKEIHDVIGHSLILALNTMESNRILHDDRDTAMRRIHQAVSEIGSSFQEIVPTHMDTFTPAHLRYTMNALSLSGKLKVLESRLLEDGIQLDLIAINEMSDCPECISSTIIRICQEAITNSIKHGKANRISISMKKKSGMIDLFIVDNGKGCRTIVKGHGLTGMEERVHGLNGTINFCSFEEREGFMVRAGIPI